jgi:hypothetical protein
MMTRDDADKLTPKLVALGSSHYGSTSWPVRLFNPIVDVEDGKPVLLWKTDACGREIAGYKEFKPGEIGHLVYRKFEIVDKHPRCLADCTAGKSWADIRVHIEMGSFGVRKSWPETPEGVNRLLSNYQITMPEPQPKDKKALAEWKERERTRGERELLSDWYNVLRALPLEEMGMSTNLLRKNVPDVQGHTMYGLDLEVFLKKHGFGEDEPLVADWDYGPEDTGAKCKSMSGDAAKMAAQYGGPPCRDPYHVDFKLNPLWVLKHKKWKGSPDGNWYKDTLDGFLKGSAGLWKTA